MSDRYNANSQQMQGPAAACNVPPQRTLNGHAADLCDRLNGLVNMLATVIDRIDGPRPTAMDKAPESKITSVPNLGYTLAQIDRLLCEADHFANTLISRV